MIVYAEACFLVSIVLFVLDGLGVAPGARLLSWGSAAFAAGFLTFALFLAPRDRRRRMALHGRGDAGSGRRAGELREDGQVGVKLDAGKTAHTER
jgi:hypothetical protein